MGRSNCISIFDANSGYWQLEVRAEDRRLTAYATNEYLYECVRVTICMKDSGSTSVRAVQQIIYPITKMKVDDMAVHLDTFSEHIQHVRMHLTEIMKSGLSLNLNKFGKS